MKIDRYVEDALRHLSGWLELLEHEDRDVLQRSCAAIGREALLDFGARNPALVHDLSIADPTQREKLLRDAPDQQTRHAMMILACHQVRLGHTWLLCAANAAADSSVDIHPIEMLMRAAAAAQVLIDGNPTLWPFDDDRDPLGEL